VQKYTSKAYAVGIISYILSRKLPAHEINPQQLRLKADISPHTLFKSCVM
jgi:hypothetical protein